MTSSVQRRWKQAADAAVAPERVETAREQLAAAVAEQVRQARGSREAANLPAAWLPGERLQGEIATRLDTTTVRLWMGLRHLDTLDAALRMGDYEDASSLMAEGRWADPYLAELLRGEATAETLALWPRSQAAPAMDRSGQYQAALTAKMLGALPLRTAAA